MQWIYGGAWILGDNKEFGEYDGKALAKAHDVVIVAANYRLDALGWLALEELQLETGDTYGNYGLADQRMALQWTQRNIERFGGLADHVTIFGESAGGFSVCQHLTAPLSNRLFSGAIIESGDCDGPWLIAPGREAKRFGDVFASDVGCPASASAAERVACLRALPLRDIMIPYVRWLCLLHRSDDPWCMNATLPAAFAASAAVAASGGPSEWPRPRPPFAPIAGFIAVVDGSPNGLPEVPLAAMARGDINVSPTGAPLRVLLGTNTDEMALFLISMPLVFEDVGLPVTDEGIASVFEQLAAFHDRWNATTAAQVEAAYPADSYSHPALRLTTMGTDFLFRCGTRTAARTLADRGLETYLYQFDFHPATYRDPGSLGCQLSAEVGCGVPHAAEVPHVWGHLDGILPAAHRMTEAMGLYWSNFAKHGSPNGDGSGASSVPVHWPRYNRTSDQHLRLANEIRVGEGLARLNCDFWDSLPRQSNYPS